MADINVSINATEGISDQAAIFVHDSESLTSATGGCLQPRIGTPLLDGIELQNFIQSWVVCVTGLSNDLVRPRWQPEPPNLPNEDWCAIGIVETDTNEYPYELHHGEGDGFTELRTHQILTILTSFYGDNADQYAGILRDGMKISQNREELIKQNFDVIGSTNVVTVPEFVKLKWLYRVDLRFQLTRQIIRRYPILNVKTADIDIITQNFNKNILINE